MLESMVLCPQFFLLEMLFSIVLLLWYIRSLPPVSSCAKLITQM